MVPFPRLLSALRCLRAMVALLALAMVWVHAPAGSRKRRALPEAEVLLKGTDQALLRRYQAKHDPAKRREQVLFPLTHESLARVVSDLAAAQG